MMSRDSEQTISACSHSIDRKQLTKQLAKLAWPMILSRLVMILTSLVGFLMLAQLGERTLAASALISASQTFIVITAMSILFSVGVVAGRYQGAGQQDDIGILLQQSLFLAVLLSIPVSLLLWFCRPILLALYQPVALVDIVERYFHAYLWTVLPQLLLVAYIQICYGIHKAKFALAINVLGLVLTVPLAYVLIFGKWGFPQLGVAGLGVAYTVVTWLLFIFMTYCFFRWPEFQHLGVFKKQPWQKLKHLRQVFAIGWPMSVQFGGEIFMFAVITFWSGWLGQDALSVRQIAMQYALLIALPIFGLSSATGITISQAVGANQKHKIRTLGHIAVVASVLIMLFVVVIYLTMPRLLTSIYLDVHDPTNAAIIKLMAIIFIIRGVTQLFDAIRNVVTGALRGLYDTRFPMFISLFSMCLVTLPLSYFLAFWKGLGIVGLFLGGTVGMLIGAGILYARWEWMSRSEVLQRH